MTRSVAMMPASAATMIRQDSLVEPVDGPIASVGGGVRAGVPTTPATWPVGLAVGPSDDTGSSEPVGLVLGGAEGGVEGGVDGGVLGGVLGGVEGGVDGGVDGGVEGGVDGGVEGGVDGGVLGGVDGGVLGGVEGGVDGGVLGGVDGGASQGWMLADLAVLASVSTRNEFTPSRCPETSSGPNG
jgi:hypothetical protein